MVANLLISPISHSPDELSTCPYKRSALKKTGSSEGMDDTEDTEGSLVRQMEPMIVIKIVV
jgi:hypothetical protein